MPRPIAWRNNWPAALEDSKRLHRPVLLEFYLEG
jgi:hypothetical protein